MTQVVFRVWNFSVHENQVGHEYDTFQILIYFQPFIKCDVTQNVMLLFTGIHYARPKKAYLFIVRYFVFVVFFSSQAFLLQCTTDISYDRTQKQKKIETKQLLFISCRWIKIAFALTLVAVVFVHALFSHEIRFCFFFSLNY